MPLIAHLVLARLDLGSTLGLALSEMAKSLPSGDGYMESDLRGRSLLQLAGRVKEQQVVETVEALAGFSNLDHHSVLLVQGNGRAGNQTSCR